MVVNGLLIKLLSQTNWLSLLGHVVAFLKQSYKFVGQLLLTSYKYLFGHPFDSTKFTSSFPSSEAHLPLYYPASVL